jgi:hypothetical protein
MSDIHHDEGVPERLKPSREFGLGSLRIIFKGDRRYMEGEE